MFCPNIQGGVNHEPTSYSQRTGWTYGASIEGCWLTGEGGGPSERTTGAVVAMDQAGEVAAKLETSFAQYGGTLSTAGGIVFSSSVDSEFFAMGDEMLEVLWTVNLGSAIEAPPISYSVNGKQYIAVPVGTSNINALFSGGGYPGRGDDPNAVSVANFQRTWTLYFFAL